MRIEIQFFGMLAEAIGKETLVLENFTGSLLGDVKTHVFSQFPVLRAFSFQMALNKKLLPENTALTHNATIAFLPPFAGG